MIDEIECLFFWEKPEEPKGERAPQAFHLTDEQVEAIVSQQPRT